MGHSSVCILIVLPILFVLSSSQVLGGLFGNGGGFLGGLLPPLPQPPATLPLPKPPVPPLPAIPGGLLPPIPLPQPPVNFSLPQPPVPLVPVPTIPILPNSAGVQFPLLGNLLNSATGLLGLANSNPSELLRLNLTISSLDLHQNKQFQCPSPLGIFPDPEDCASFYICSLGIVELKLSCVVGYHYEPGLLLLCLPNNPSTLPERCNSCPAYKGPKNCTLSPYHCSFCIQKPYGGGPRCDLYANLRKAGCNEASIYNVTSNSGNDTRLIDPYDNSTDPIYTNLLPGDKKQFTITFQLAAHPLDVYLLMDISGSMRDDKASVVQLSSKLTTFLANLTNDYTLGFGAFSDKVDAYTYRNILKLSNETSNFSSTVDSTPMEGGGDFPEDAGTAMFESAICENEIGWRSNTRRLLFVLTDATFHVANDGWRAKVGAAPFDGKCHLDATGIYTEKLTQDYPSIPQLVDILSQQQITVLFGIVDGRAFYEELATQIKPSAIGLLSSDSSNIIDLLDKEYRKLASRVEMQHSNTSKEIQIKYYSNCNGNGSTTTGSGSSVSETETSLCEGLPLNGQVTFTVEIGLSECPKDPAEWKQTIKVYAAGLPRYIEVPLQMICGDW